MKFNSFLSATMALALGATVFASCSDDDDDNNGGSTAVVESSAKFVVVSLSSEKDANGTPVDLADGSYIKVFSDLSNTTRTNEKVYGDNVNGLEVLDGFTQFDYNPTTQLFTAWGLCQGCTRPTVWYWAAETTASALTSITLQPT